MSDLIQEYLSEYRERQGKLAEYETTQLQLEDEIANLGGDVIERGANKLLEKYDVDLESIEKENEKLNKKLCQRFKKLSEQLLKPPPHVAEEDKSSRRVIQQIASAQHKNACLVRPPEDMIPWTSCAHGAGRCDLDTDITESHMYPVLSVTGSRRSGLRRSIAQCIFVWTFIPRVTAVYNILPYFFVHGHRVITLEYHCFHDSDGTSNSFEVSVSYSQPTFPFATGFRLLSTALPAGLRIDTFLSGHDRIHLWEGHRVYVHVRVRLQSQARSRYATAQMNFGDPRDDNYIENSILCYSAPGDS